MKKSASEAKSEDTKSLLLEVNLRQYFEALGQGPIPLRLAALAARLERAREEAEATTVIH